MCRVVTRQDIFFLQSRRTTTTATATGLTSAHGATNGVLGKDSVEYGGAKVVVVVVVVVVRRCLQTTT